MKAKINMTDESEDSIGCLLVDMLSLKAVIDLSYQNAPFPEDDLHHIPDDQLLLAFNALREDQGVTAPIVFFARKGGGLFDIAVSRISRREFISFSCCLCEQEFTPEEICSDYWNGPQGWDGRVLSCPAGHLIARTVEVMT